MVVEKKKSGMGVGAEERGRGYGGCWRRLGDFESEGERVLKVSFYSIKIDKIKFFFLTNLLNYNDQFYVCMD